jgi:archaemetzincin
MYTVPSRAASRAGYILPSTEQFAGATTETGRAPRHLTGEALERAAKRAPENGNFLLGLLPDASSFPAPLVLPDDELFYEPKPMLQSFRAWDRLKERNLVTPERRTIYVVPPPSTTGYADCAAWTRPASSMCARKERMPKVDDVVAYMSAFYTGMPVRKLDAQLRFAQWVDEPPTKRARGGRAARPPTRVAIECPGIGETIGVLYRPDPTDTFAQQLSLNDVLDVALELLPEDAYAVLMLMEHDLFEDDDDDFCVGRAFGGSRIAVVSMARYACNLVGKSEHDWPLSHCSFYIDEICKTHAATTQTKKNGKARKMVKPTGEVVSVVVDGSTPMGAAILAAKKVPAEGDNLKDDQLDYDTWLLRTCRTATHEVGHCLGLDHCEYYACIMQSTASVPEDLRQPPYLCPVCSKKVLTATGVEDKDWTAKMKEVCQGRIGMGWQGLQGWCEGRLQELEV